MRNKRRVSETHGQTARELAACCRLQQWHTALGGTVAASRAEGGWAGGRQLRLGAVGKAGRFGGLHLEKKTRLYKGL